MPNCESHSVQIDNTYKKIATDLLNLFTEFNSQNESLVSTLNTYSTDINANKEAITDVLDEYTLMRMNCCYNLVLNIDQIISILNEIPCVDSIINIPTTTTAAPTTTATPTTTLDVNICNAATIVNKKGSYYPYTIVKYLGVETGIVTLNFNSNDIPDRFVVEFDGVEVIDTGYVGDPVFQVYLDAVVYAQGDVVGDITNTSTGSISFTKSTITETATVKVYSPLGNTRFEFTMTCPDEAVICMDIILDVLEINFKSGEITTTTIQYSIDAESEMAIDSEGEYALDSDYQ